MYDSLPSLLRCAAALAVLASCAASSLRAQTTQLAAESRRILCGTTTDEQVTCKTDGYAIDVRMTRDLNGGRCRRGTNWGFTDSFIWANRRCRAEFEITYHRTGGPTAPSPRPPAATRRRITCGTTIDKRDTCNTEGYATHVRLLRDLSRGRCREGSTWGFTDAFIWTSNRCVAEFEVVFREAMPVRPPPATIVSKTMTCGTTFPVESHCRTGVDAMSVRLLRDLYEGNCRDKGSWGYTRTEIWTRQRCKGEFEVVFRR